MCVQFILQPYTISGCEFSEILLDILSTYNPVWSDTSANCEFTVLARPNHNMPIWGFYAITYQHGELYLNKRINKHIFEYGDYEINWNKKRVFYKEHSFLNNGWHWSWTLNDLIPWKVGCGARCYQTFDEKSRFCQRNWEQKIEQCRSQGIRMT